MLNVFCYKLWRLWISKLFEREAVRGMQYCLERHIESKNFQGETVTTKTLTDFTFAVFKLEYGYPLNYFSFILNVKLMHNLIFIFYLKSTLSYLPSLIFWNIT